MYLRCHRSKSVWATLGVLALCWLYIFPVYRIPSDKEMVDEVLRQGQTWTRNQTGINLYRYLKAFLFSFTTTRGFILSDGLNVEATCPVMQF